MVFVKLALVSILLARAVYTDIKKGRIENLLTGIGILLGLVCSVAEAGISGLLISVKMAVFIIAALFFLFVMRGLGAGDIKLLAALAAFFPKEIVVIVITAFFVAAGISVGRMILRMLRRQAVYKRREQINFSIPIAIATGMVELHSFFY